MIKKFNPTFGEFLFQLVPKDYNPKNLQRLQKKKEWSFNLLKSHLLSIKDIKEDSENKSWGDLDDECYYSLKINEEKILFEINSGKASDDVDLPIISIKFSSKIPSKEGFEKFCKIVEKLAPILNCKIYSGIANDYIELEKLRKYNELLK